MPGMVEHPMPHIQPAIGARVASALARPSGASLASRPPTDHWLPRGSLAAACSSSSASAAQASQGGAFVASFVVAGVLGAARLRPPRATRGSRAVRLAEAKDEAQPTGTTITATPEAQAETQSSNKKPSAAESREQLMSATETSSLPESQRSAVSNFFFPEPEELDMDKSMPLDDHIREFREGVLRTLAAAVICVGVCLTYYKELTTALEAPAMANGAIVKFVQLGPGEFFFVSLKAAVAVGLLLAFPYALFEAALYFTPALTKSERDTVGPTVLSSAALFYAGVFFSQNALAPAALGFFVSYSQDVIESQFSIDQYFEFILSMGFATGLAFQVPILQVTLGLLNILSSEQLFSVWRYVIVASAVVGAILTPSTDPVTQLLLSGALCALYFAGAGVLVLVGR